MTALVTTRRLALIICIAAMPASAQTTPPASAKSMEKMEHHGMSNWKEMDAFHTVMAATWHPARKDSLGAIRLQADSLHSKAKQWAASKVPTACDTKEIRDAMADVVKGSEGIVTLVKSKAADADVKKALSDVHDRFEVVEHGCHGS